MLTKKELIDRVATDTGLPKATVENVLDTAGKQIADYLSTIDPVEGAAVLPGLGRLVVEVRAARTGRNPQTGEPVEIPARQVVKFRPTGALSDAVAVGQEGHTCDKPLCERHARQVGSDRHYCPEHFAQHQADSSQREPPLLVNLT